MNLFRPPSLQIRQQILVETTFDKQDHKVIVNDQFDAGLVDQPFRRLIDQVLVLTDDPIRIPDFKATSCVMVMSSEDAGSGLSG